MGAISRASVLASVPAGMHRTADCLRSPPPCWPVSGLAETTRVSFPDPQGIQWTEDTSRGPKSSSAYRCGGSSGWRVSGGANDALPASRLTAPAGGPARAPTETMIARGRPVAAAARLACVAEISVTGGKVEARIAWAFAKRQRHRWQSSWSVRSCVEGPVHHRPSSSTSTRRAAFASKVSNGNLPAAPHSPA